jgi:hypothetical protein
MGKLKQGLGQMRVNMDLWTKGRAQPGTKTQKGERQNKVHTEKGAFVSAEKTVKVKDCVNYPAVGWNLSSKRGTDNECPVVK